MIRNMGCNGISYLDNPYRESTRGEPMRCLEYGGVTKFYTSQTVGSIGKSYVSNDLLSVVFALIERPVKKGDNIN